jgi:hypothetical protein
VLGPEKLKLNPKDFGQPIYFGGAGKMETCFQICFKQFRKSLVIQGAISDFNFFGQ